MRLDKAKWLMLVPILGLAIVSSHQVVHQSGTPSHSTQRVTPVRTPGDDVLMHELSDQRIVTSNLGRKTWFK